MQATRRAERPNSADYPQGARSRTRPTSTARMLGSMLNDGFRPDWFGVARRSDLLRSGESDISIRDAIDRDVLTRPRRGWYALRQADPEVVAAIRAGGVLTCTSALRMRGVLTLPVAQPHIRLTEHNARRYTADTAALHVCAGVERDARKCSRSVDSLRDATISALGCLDGTPLIVALDSLQQQRHFTIQQLLQLRTYLPRAARRALARSNGMAESVSETVLHLALERARIRHRQQVPIAGYRVDVLIGKRLIVEVDSRAFHHLPDAYAADRRRDRKLATLGYHVVRLTYEDVLFRMDEVLVDIGRLLQSGVHLYRARVVAL